jgi:predicted small secreted protein
MGEKSMRRTLVISALLSIAAFLSACGGNYNTSVNAGRADTDTTVNSERIDSSNIAPTGGPGPEPESRGTQSSANANETKADNKNKTDNKNRNTQ